MFRNKRCENAPCGQGATSLQRRRLTSARSRERLVGLMPSLSRIGKCAFDKNVVHYTTNYIFMIHSKIRI